MITPYLEAMNRPGQDRHYFNERFWKNRPAVAGLLLILGICITSALGYLIIPDSSPDANYQFPEYALEKPGFRLEVLEVPRIPEPAKEGLLTRMLVGQPPRIHSIPFTEYRVDGDSVNVMRQGGDTAVFHVGDQISNIRVSMRVFPLGTDRFGRCFLSRLVIGARVSLAVGLIAVVISLTIGLLLGALAGYSGGRTDNVIMLLINAVWSIPTILLVFAIVLSLGRHAWNVYLAVGLTMWVDVARLVRGQVIDLKSRPFVEAAKSMGFRGIRILFYHILPNIIGPLLVITAANFAMAILIEAGLSYLGFGIQPPQPSWGNLLNEHYGFALSGHIHLAVIPALCIMLLVLSFNLLGNGLRDAFDVKAGARK